MPLLLRHEARVIPGPPPARFYVHDSATVYGGVPKEMEAMDTLLSKNSLAFTGMEYMIAVLWGDKEEPVMDVFGFHDIKEWPGNPTVRCWGYRKGVLRLSQDITCGDTLIVLGEEEALRRVSPDLETYLSKPPRPVLQNWIFDKVTPIAF